jgi:hypothetical protein
MSHISARRGLLRCIPPARRPEPAQLLPPCCYCTAAAMLAWCRRLLAAHLLQEGLQASASGQISSSSSSSSDPEPAAATAPFHVARSTRWPCLQFGLPCSPVGSNTFAGALIMCNDTAVDREGRACCSAQHYADPLDRLCYTTPTEVRDALSVVPEGNKLIGVVDGE